MIINREGLLNYPVLSLHVGAEIARVSEIIIDPNDLKIAAFKLNSPLINGEVGSYLRPDSIRETSRTGFIVDSIDEFVDPADIINLSNVLKLNFKLLGLKVVSKKSAKLGKILNYTVNTDTFNVWQIIIKRPLSKSFVDPKLTIHRSQILEVSDTKVIVKNHAEKAALSPEEFIPNFVNPFRDPNAIEALKISSAPEGNRADFTAPDSAAQIEKDKKL